MIELRYETEKTEDGQSRVSLSCNGEHIGSVWGTVRLNKKDDFERGQNMIHIHQGDNRVATFWDAQPAEG